MVVTRVDERVLEARDLEEVSLGLHLPRGYIYFAMAFSAFIELINMRLRRNRGAATATAEA